MNLRDKRAFLKPRCVIGVALVAVVMSAVSASAQAVTVAPDTVDPAKLQPASLRVLNADGTLNSALLGQVTSVTVGGTAAEVRGPATAAGLAIMPPKLDGGIHEVRLLGMGNAVLAQGQLRYQTSIGQTSQAAQTPQVSSQVIESLARQREIARLDQLAGSGLYYTFVAVMFAAVLGPFVLAIYRNMKPELGTNSRPLGLPVGSFRSILAYSLVTYVGFYVLASVLSLSQFLPPDFLLGIVATVVGFYFGSRAGEEGEAKAAKTGTVRGLVRQGMNAARGAIIKFRRSEDGTTPYSRISDTEGRFELSGVRPGKYMVQASLTGVPPSDEQEVAVSEGSDHEIEIGIKSGGSPPSPLPQTGIVQGAITKPDGTPAPGATVILSQSGVERFKKTTDAGGKFKIDSVTPGQYDVEASLTPHTPSDRTKVNVTAGGQHTVDAKLK